MQLTTKNTNVSNYGIAVLRAFLIWNFTLAVCLLVVGFPLVMIMATVASMAAIVLQSVLPVSAVLVVVGGTIGLNLLAIVGASTVLTLKGIHPSDVSWLQWLEARDYPQVAAKFASCPLTCDLTSV